MGEGICVQSPSIHSLFFEHPYFTVGLTTTPSLGYSTYHCTPDVQWVGSQPDHWDSLDLKLSSADINMAVASCFWGLCYLMSCLSSGSLSSSILTGSKLAIGQLSLVTKDP